MTTHREGIFVEGLWVENSPLDSSIPHVDDVGVTSAPLQSMAYAFGERCQEYSEDFMLCKNASQDPKACLKEGRKVTRCAIDLYQLLTRIEKLKKNCDDQWTNHWQCLDKNNQMYEKCRPQERVFNECLFTKLVFLVN